MASALAYIPELIRFPTEVPFDASLVEPIDDETLKQHLQESLPVENLMLWLLQHYGEQPDATLLRLYHELVREPLWLASLHPDSTTTDLQEVLVSYHPYRIQRS
nr:hypothetical protein [Aeromonas caviae]